MTTARNTTFKEGGAYFGRFISNYDHTVVVRIIKRTPKTVIFEDLNTGESKRVKIHKSHYDGKEILFPYHGVSIPANKEAAQ